MNRKKTLIFLAMLAMIGVIVIILTSLKIHKLEKADSAAYLNVSSNIANTVWQKVKDEPISEVTVKFDNGDEVTFNSMNSLTYSSKAVKDLNRLYSFLIIITFYTLVIITLILLTTIKRNVFFKSN